MFKKFLETKGISAEQFKGLEAEKQMELQNEYLGTIEEKAAKSASKEDLETAKADFQTELNVLTEKMRGFGAVPTENEILETIKANHDAIKQAYKSNGVVELTFKAVVNVTTGAGSNVAAPAITGTQQAPISNINLRDIGVLPLTTQFNTNLSAYPYTEAVPKEGDYAFLAEGILKPQFDFSWSTRYAQPVKTAAWVRLTEEAVQDVAGLESVARDFLFKKHNLKKSKGILFGDGISPNPKGATAYGRAFSAGPLAASVVEPNFMDVVNAAITDIATTHNYEDEMAYMPNLVMINYNDFFINLVSAKDKNGLPLYPSASLFNQVNIGGITIVPEESIPAGKIFVADMSKYNTTNYMPYTVKIGWVNDDFVKNQFVILAESRFHAFVKRLDEQAFIYDNIATIKTAITKP